MGSAGRIGGTGHADATWRLAVAVAALFALFALGDHAVALWTLSETKAVVDRDFANYWIGARLALSGQAGDLFGPHEIYHAHLRDAFGQDYPWRNWSYPPHWLLFTAWLGAFDYLTAQLLFLAVTGLAFVVALRTFSGATGWLLAATLLPIAIHNVWAAQNGFLTGALALGALALRDSRPVLAGVLLGCLTVKPQLGILFPLLLLFERRWTMIAVATATTAALVLASAALFGWSAWRGYVTEVLPYQTDVMRNFVGIFLDMMPSAYGVARNLGVGPDAAMAIHAPVALAALFAATLMFIRCGDAQLRAATLLVATFLVTPYALSYDLGLVSAAAAATIVSGGAAVTLRDWPRLTIVAAMLLPLLMIPLGQAGIPLGPVILAALMALLVRMSIPLMAASPAATSD